MSRPFNGLTLTELRSIYGGRTRADVLLNIQERLAMQNAVLPHEEPTPGALLHVPPSVTRSVRIPRKKEVKPC